MSLLVHQTPAAKSAWLCPRSDLRLMSLLVHQTPAAKSAWLCSRSDLRLMSLLVKMPETVSAPHENGRG
jgi:alkaline phosphatase